MSEAQKLINSILSNPRLTQSRAFAGKSFDSEPILRTGHDLRQGMPEQYKKMRNLGRPVYDGQTYVRPTETKLFVAQARFMANWEDHVPYQGNFKRYFPTYSMMNDRQLRGYFTWRAQVRQGNVQETSLSYAFVYAYELINCVHGSPLECFQQLLAFWNAYRPYAENFDRYAKSWLRDFVIYYGLEPTLLEEFLDLSFEKSLICLRMVERQVVAHNGASFSSNGAQDVSQALVRLGKYSLNSSKYGPEYLQDFSLVSSQVFANLALHYAKHRKKGVVESWFGSPQASEHEMFQAAVFYEPQKHADARYDVNEVHSYSCQQGRWYALRRYKKAAPNPEIGRLLQAIESELDGKLGSAGESNLQLLPKYQQAMVEQAVAAYVHGKKAAEARKVVINRSALADIRNTAANTREQLLIEEERLGAGFTEEPSAEEWQRCGVNDRQDSGDGKDALQAQPTLDCAEVTSTEFNLAANLAFSDSADDGRAATSLLTDEEASYLRALLQGSPIDAFLDADLLVDTINEKLFDLLGDSAIEFGDFGPQVIEDYREELEGVVQ